MIGLERIARASRFLFNVLRIQFYKQILFPGSTVAANFGRSCVVNEPLLPKQLTRP